MAKKTIKRSPASLFGGVIIALMIFAIWVLNFDDPSTIEIGIGAAIALAVGIWTRVANL